MFCQFASVVVVFVSQTIFRPEGDLQQIWGEGQYGKVGRSCARASSLAQEKGVLLLWCLGNTIVCIFARAILRPSTNSSSGQTSMLHLAPQPIWKLAFSTSRQASKNHILFISMSGEQSLQTLLWLLGFDDSHCHQWTRLPPWASLGRPDHYSQRLERVHLFGCCGGDLHADQPPGQVDRRS